VPNKVPSEFELPVQTSELAVQKSTIRTPSNKTKLLKTRICPFGAGLVAQLHLYGASGNAMRSCASRTVASEFRLAIHR
jgi:hypothetical protein